MNPPMWRDYLKTPGQFEYRVVAVGCEDSNSTAISDTAVVLISFIAEAQNNKSNWVLYPNPATDILNLQANEVQTNGILEIIGMDGKMVLKQQLTQVSDQFSLDVSNLPSGLFLIRISTSESLTTLRFVKR